MALRDDAVRLHPSRDALQAPRPLSIDDTYAVTAYLLSENGIKLMGDKVDKQSLPKMQMPNRDGFIVQPEFRVIKNSK